jgi:hypothetical protein
MQKRKKQAGGKKSVQTSTPVSASGRAAWRAA